MEASAILPLLAVARHQELSRSAAQPVPTGPEIIFTLCCVCEVAWGVASLVPSLPPVRPQVLLVAVIDIMLEWKCCYQY